MRLRVAMVVALAACGSKNPDALSDEQVAGLAKTARAMKDANPEDVGMLLVAGVGETAAPAGDCAKAFADYLRGNPAEQMKAFRLAVGPCKFEQVKDVPVDVPTNSRQFVMLHSAMQLALFRLDATGTADARAAADALRAAVKLDRPAAPKPSSHDHPRLDDVVPADAGASSGPPPG